MPKSDFSLAFFCFADTIMVIRNFAVDIVQRRSLERWSGVESPSRPTLWDRNGSHWPWIWIPCRGWSEGYCPSTGFCATAHLGAKRGIRLTTVFFFWTKFWSILVNMVRQNLSQKNQRRLIEGTNFFGLGLFARLHEFLTFHTEFLTFNSNFSLFQPAPLPCLPPHHSHTGRPFQWHGYYHVIVMFCRAGARQKIPVCHAGVRSYWEVCWKSENFVGKVAKSEKLAGKVAKSEKFKPKVRNSLDKWPKVRNSSQKWEICVVAQT